MSFSHMASDGKSLMFFNALMRVSACESDSLHRTDHTKNDKQRIADL